jgi:hypothetical protein
VCPAHHLVEHRRLQIEGIDLASRFEMMSDLEGVVSGAWSYLQHALARCRCQKVQESIPPQERAWQVEEDSLTEGAGCRAGPLPQHPGRHRSGTQEHHREDYRCSLLTHWPSLSTDMKSSFA